jgi:Ohr subfamily peroxiredoxin
MTIALERVLYTAKASARGGRDGHTETDDGQLSVELRTPPELGGPGGGTNPEQLFAAGYAACFQNALTLVSRRAKVDTSGSTVTAEVDLGPVGRAYAMGVRLQVSIPGVDQATAEQLVATTHQVCPYSIAIGDNIVVEITAV